MYKTVQKNDWLFLFPKGVEKMYFSDDPEDRKYEKLMRLPPYHRSRGYGVYVSRHA